MLARLWLASMLVHRPGRLLGALIGVALTVALLGSLGAFLASSAASMTERAVAEVPVDWQILLAPGADASAVAAAVGESTSYSALETVGYADSAGFSASGTIQNTGPGQVVGLSAEYRSRFPAQIRALVGSPDGVLLAQQTAANLSVAVGDTVTVKRVGLPPVNVKIDGVVNLPNADAFFQAVGLPAGAAPQAPPDNVLLMPSAQWHTLFDPQGALRPDSVRTQLHVRLAGDLPESPDAAFGVVQQRARNLEARIAGGGIVGDNVSARLDGVRADALYSRVLFLFLGLPGAILSLWLTLAVAASGAGRRRQEQALLRTRGASTTQILRLAGLEAAVVGGAGVALGVALAYAAAATIAPAEVLRATTTARWIAGAAVLGLLLSVVALLFPAWREARLTTVAAAHAIVGRARRPLWQRMYLDLLLLAASALAFWQTASTGYQVVLAPEGVAQTSVSYQAFLAPVGLWVGMGLFATRLLEIGLVRGRSAVVTLLRPIAQGMSGVVAASLGRQRARITRGVVLVALAFSFASSTAIFNTTYNAQSQVDAELTNGANVTITGTTAAPPSGLLPEITSLEGVSAVQLMQHRFAYVGNDLQDLYGIDSAHIAEATNMANAFFAGGDAQATLAALAARQDGVLVAAETVNDYQLQPGDLVNLRLQSIQDHQYHIVPFHFVGVVREFPTAPKDSFLVANAQYVAQQTGTDAAEIALLRSDGNPARLADEARAAVRSLAGARVSDIGSTQRTISSSLTAVDLHGLTRLELAFALLLVVGATGLVMALGLAERRRTFAILTALGARDAQLGGFLWSEGLVILLGGATIGVATGVVVAQMLVIVLTGVFDPAPETLAVPWDYLALLAVAATASTVIAVLNAHRLSRQPVVEALRGF